SLSHLIFTRVQRRLPSSPSPAYCEKTKCFGELVHRRCNLLHNLSDSPPLNSFTASVIEISSSPRSALHYCISLISQVIDEVNMQTEDGSSHLDALQRV
ncbi:unnamed protein product, partial [Linum tenue]